MTVLFILPKTVSFFEKQVLLLYYLYCLCKSLQRSLLLCRLSFQESGCKGKNFLSISSKYFRKFFFHLSFFPSSLLRKGEQKKDCFTDPDSRKSVSTNAAYFLKAGAKVRTLFHIFQIFPEVFFSFCFFKWEISERNKPQAEEIGKSSYAVPVRMSKHRCSRSRKRVQK